MMAYALFAGGVGAQSAQAHTPSSIASALLTQAQTPSIVAATNGDFREDGVLRTSYTSTEPNDNNLKPSSNHGNITLDYIYDNLYLNSTISLEITNPDNVDISGATYRWLIADNLTEYVVTTPFLKLGDTGSNRDFSEAYSRFIYDIRSDDGIYIEAQVNVGGETITAERLTLALLGSVSISVVGSNTTVVTVGSVLRGILQSPNGVHTAPNYQLRFAWLVGTARTEYLWTPESVTSFYNAAADYTLTQTDILGLSSNPTIRLEVNSRTGSTADSNQIGWRSSLPHSNIPNRTEGSIKLFDGVTPLQIRIEQAGQQLSVVLTPRPQSGVQYRWTEGSSTNTNSFDVINNATGRIYSPPTIYDADFGPRIGMRASYADESGDTQDIQVINSFILNSPNSGGASLDGSGTAEGDSYAINFSALRDSLGRAVDESFLTYEWQVGDVGSGTFSPIDGQTARSYILDAAHVSAGNTAIRAEISSKNGSFTATTPAINAAGLLGASLLTINGNFADGATLAADVSQLSDTNSANYTYVWQRSIDNGLTFQPISGQTAVEYVVSGADFSGTSTNAQIQVVATAGGVSETSTRIYVQVPLNVQTEYLYDRLYTSVESGFTDYSTVTLNILSSNIAPSNLTYSWFIRRDGVAPTQRNFATSTLFSMSNIRGYLSPLPLSALVNRSHQLQAVVSYADPLSGDTFTHEAGYFNIQIAGTVRIEIVNGGESNSVEAGSTLQVVLDDPNGVNNANYVFFVGNTVPHALIFRWNIGGRAFETNWTPTGFNQQPPPYTLSTEDITNLNNNGNVGVTVILTNPFNAAISQPGWVDLHENVNDKAGEANASRVLQVGAPGVVPEVPVTVEITHSGNGVLQAALSRTPAGVVRYVWTEGSGDSFAPIAGAADAATYTVPTTYTADYGPLVGVNVIYTNDSGEEVTAVLVAPLGVVGIDNADTVVVGISGGNDLELGALSTVDISNLRDPLGRSLDASHVEYQWLTGDSESSLGEVSATGVVFTLAAGHFTGSKTYFGVEVNHKDFPDTKIRSNILRLSVNTISGSVSIDGLFWIGTELTANLSGLRNVGDSPTYTYEWLLSKNGAPFVPPLGPGQFGSTYTPQRSDRTGSNVAVLRLAVTHNSGGVATAFFATGTILRPIAEIGGVLEDRKVLTAVVTNLHQPTTFEWRNGQGGNIITTFAADRVPPTYTLNATRDFGIALGETGTVTLELVAVGSVDNRKFRVAFVMTAVAAPTAPSVVAVGGNIAIDGVRLVGATLTANISGLTDVGSAPTYTYQWARSDGSGGFSNIADKTTDNTYVIFYNDSPQLRLLVSHNNGSGVESSFLSTVDIPLPVVRIDGVFAHGQVLTAVVSNIHSGLGSFRRTNNNGSDSSLANNTTLYTVDASEFTDVTIPAEIQFVIFGLNIPRIRISHTPLVTVGGSIRITGAEQGVPTNTILRVDFDGLTNAGSAPRYTYQWARFNETTGGFTDISGTGSTYNIVPADHRGSTPQLRLLVTHDNGFGFKNSFSVTLDTSPPSVRIDGIFADGQVLTAVVSNIHGRQSSYSFRRFLNNASATGPIANGVTLYTVNVHQFSELPPDVAARIQFVVFGYNVGRPVITPTRIVTVGGSIRIADSNSVHALRADVSGLTNASRAPRYTYQWSRRDDAGSEFEDITGATNGIYTLTADDRAGAPMQLRVSLIHDDGFGFKDSFVSPAFNILPPSARIDGILAHGQVLTAVVNNVYGARQQSFRRINDVGGSSPLANNVPFYTVDVNHFPAVTSLVKVLFIVYETNIPPIIITHTPLVPVGGSIRITGAESGMAIGSILTADISGLTNTDGEGGATYTYQWARRGERTSEFTNISGATNNTYAIANDDLTAGVAPQLRVSVSHKNGFNLVVPFLSTLATRLPVAAQISGDFAVGATLTATGSGFSGDVTYEWQASTDGGGTFVAIAGQANQTYIVDAADFADAAVAAQIQAVVSGGGDSAAMIRAYIPTTSVGGNIAIDESGLRVNATLTADISGLTNTGAARYTYQWARRGEGTDEFTNISGATNNTYIIITDDAAGSAPQLRLSVLHNDGLGVENTFLSTATVDTTPPPTTMTTTPPEPGGGTANGEGSYLFDNLYLATSESGTVSVNLEIVTGNISSYRWDLIARASGRIGIPTDDDSSWTSFDTDAIAELDDIATAAVGGSNNYYIRAVVEIGGAERVLEPLRITRPPTPRVEVVGGGNIVGVGSEVVLVFGDPNGIGSAQELSAVWSVGVGNTALGTSAFTPSSFSDDRSPSYTLTAEDISLLSANPVINVDGGVLFVLLGFGNFFNAWPDVTGGNNPAININFAVEISSEEGVTVSIVTGGDVLRAELSRIPDGGVTYQWQQGAIGGSFANIASANSATYTPPQNYAADFGPVVGVVATYQSGLGADANAKLLTPVTVFGIANPEDAAALENPSSGEYAIDLAGLIDPSGRAINESYVSYEWQSGASAQDGFGAIAGETSRTYTADAADFAGGKRFIRAVITDLAGVSSPIALTGLNIGDLADSDLRFSGRFIVGATLTADASRLSGGYTYSWQGSSDGGGSYSEIGTGNTYIVAVGDFANVRTNSAIARIRLVATPTGGGAAITSADLSYAPPKVEVTYRYTNLYTSTSDDILHSTISLDITEDVDASGYTYQWRVYRTDINSGTESTRQLTQTQHLQLCCSNRGQFSGSDEQLISVLVEVLDPLGGALQTPTPQGGEDGSIRLDRAGSVRISLTGIVGGAQAGDSLAVYLDDINGAISDNGIADETLYNLTWLSDGAVLTTYSGLSVDNNNNGRLAAASDYILTAADITRLATDGIIRARVGKGAETGIWTDTLGFDNDGNGALALIEGITPGVQINGSFAVGGALTATAANFGGVVTYEWQASTNGGSNFTPIADETAQTYIIDAADFAGATVPAQIQVVASSGSESAIAVTTYSPAALVGGIIAIDESGLGSGAIVTANISSLTNTGAATYTYQWARRGSGTGGFTNISGATNNTYTIASDDTAAGSAPQLRLSVLYTDALGYTASFVSTPVNVERPAVAVQIGGSFAVGETLTATESGFIGVVTYEWQASTDGGSNFTPITGEVAQTYIVDATDFTGATVPAQIQVVASSGSDSATAAMIYSPAALVGGNIAIDESGLGSGAIVTANISSLTNTGAATYTYQWARRGSGTGGFTNISGATNNTYTIASDDTAAGIAPQLRLSVLYTDALGYTASFSSNPVNVERPAVAVQIGGDFAVGETLTATGSDFIGVVTYVWQASTDGGNTFTPITDETAQTYIVDATDFAGATTLAQIQVIVSGGGESATMAMIYSPDSVSGNIAIGESGLGIGAIVTADISSLTNTDDAATYTYQWARRGDASGSFVDISAATNNTYTIVADDAAGSAPQLQLSVVYADALGYTASFVSNPVGVIKPEPITVGIEIANDGNVTAVLSRDVSGTSYTWMEGSPDSSFSNIDVNGSGQSYIVPTTYAPDFGPFVRLQFQVGAETTITAPLRVVGVTNPDVSLPLTSVVASEIQVDISALRDPLNRAVDASLLTYQWQVGNAADVYSDISGQNDATYTLQMSHFDIDIGITFLRVRLTDRSGLAAEAFDSSAANLAFGLRNPQIVGEFTDNGVLSVDIAGQSGVTYEWQRSLDGGTNFVSIPSATTAVYGVQPGDFAGAGDFAAVIQVILKSALLQFTSDPRTYTPPTRDLQAELDYDSLIIGTTANVYSTVSINIRSVPSNASISYFWEVVRNGETLRIGTDTTPQLGLFNDSSPTDTYLLVDGNRHTLRAAVSVVSSFGGVQRITLAETVIEREGEIAIALDNNEELFIGSQINAIVSDTNGVAQENYTIEWTVGGEVRDVLWASPPLAVSVTTSNYTLTEEDITNLATTPQISVRILLSGADGFLDSLRNINDGVAATITVTPVPALQVTLGIVSGEVSATLSRALSTPEGEVQYVWEEGNSADGDFAVITDATLGAYTPPTTYAADFGPYIRVRVTYNYGGGTTSTSVNSAGLRVVGVATIAEVNNISGDGVVVGSTYTFTRSGLKDPLGRDVDSSLLNYQWYSSNSADSSSVAIAGATTAEYVLAVGVFDNNSPGLFLQVTDKSSLATASISSPTLNLSRAASGQPLIEVIGGGSLDAGATLQVSGGVTDENGVGEFSGYSWAGDGDEDVGTPRNNDSELVLNDTAVVVLGGGGAVVMTLTHTDGLGFTTPFIVSFRQLAVILSLNAGTNSVDAEVNDISSVSTGSYTYQWQRSATESGGYTNIEGENNASYVVLQDNIAEPFVRVNVGYTLTATGNATAQASSRGVRAVGIDSSGAVSATGGGVIIGATRTADISDIEDLFGRAVPSNYLTYQWQVSDLENGTYSDISGAESQTYNLAAGDFADGKSFLRVQVESAVAGDSYTDESAGDNIEQTATGAVSIDGTDYHPGGEFTANTSGIIDINGVAENTYQWSQDSGGGFGDISGETNATYAVDVTDFTGSGISPTLRVIVTHADAFGFTTNFTAAVQFTNADTTGTIGIVVTGYAHDDVLTLSHNVADANAGATPVELVNIAWQRRAGDSGDFVADISATGDTYTIDRDDWAPQDMLRVVAEYVDPFGAQTSLTASAVLINQPTQGAAQIEIVGGGSVSDGTLLRAITAGITDENGLVGYDFQWFGGTSDKSSATSETYNLTGEDVGAIESGNAVGVEVVHTDDLGFVTTLTATFSRVVVSLIVNNATFTAVPDDNGISDEDYRYQWQQSETANGTYVAILAATNSIYTVPSGYDASREHLRVSVSYTITGEGSAFSFSRSTVVAGIDSGSVLATGDDFDAGATRTADISSLRSVLGQEVQAEQVGYQWQVGSAASGDDSYSNIGGATLRVYTLATANFNNSDRYLRVRIIDLADENNTRDSVGEEIEKPSTGDVSIDGNTFAPDGVFTANTDSVTDENGAVTHAYQWLQDSGDGFGEIDGETNASYTVDAADFIGSGISPTLQVIVTHTDVFGFIATSTATVQFINAASGGNISISGDSYAVGDVLTLSHSITDENTGTADIVLVDIEWQQRTGDSGDFAAIADETGNTYTIDATDWMPHDMLRAVAVYVDPFGARTGYTVAAVVEINRAPRGELRIEVVGDDEPVAGTILQVITANVSDGNGTESIGGYQWIDGDGVEISGATGATYTLTADDIEAAQSGNAVGIRAVHTDGLGFVATLTATFRQVLVTLARSGASSTFTANVEDRDNIDNGDYDYQWQQSETANGDYINIAGETNASYTVPSGYDASREHLRVSVSYTITNGGADAFSLSRSTVVAGIDSGSVLATGNGFGAGATRTADIGSLRSVLEQPVQPAQVRYQWQVGSAASGDDSYSNISDATLRVYTLATADFNDSDKYLRVRIIDLADSANTRDSTGEEIEQPSTGDVSIDGNNFAPSGVFTANTSRVGDNNGIGAYTYQWSQESSGSFGDISGATNASYTVDAADLSGSGETPLLRVIVTHTDAFGFITTSTAAVQFTNTASGGNISISGDSYEAGDVLTLLHSVADVNAGTIDIVLVDIEWQQRTGDSGDFVAIADETGNTYAIDATDWSPHDMLRAVAFYVDPFGARTGYTASVVEINRPTSEGLQIEVVGGGEPLAGTTLQVNTANVSDGNGTDSIGDYQWIDGDGVDISGETGATYILTADDITAMQSGNAVGIRAVHTDGLGFVVTLNATFRQVLVNLARSGARFTANPDDVDDIDNGDYRFQWQQSDEADGVYTNIAGAGSRSYTVPSSYDASREHLRVSVSYTITNGDVAAFSYSRSTVVAGIDSGSVSATGGGFGANATRRANISSLRSVLEQPVQAAQVGYQWQVSDAENGTYSDISGEESQTYALAVADFTDSNRYLRVRIIDLANESKTHDSAGEEIEQPSTGVLSIGGSNFAPGGVFTANTRGVRDANGIGAYTYEWMRGDGVLIAGETDDTYTLAVSDFDGITTPDLRLVAVHTDAFGFVVTLTSGITVNIQNAATGNIAINTNAGYAHDDVLILSPNIRDANAGTVAIELVDIEWQQSTGGGDFANIVGETGNTYTINATDWSPHDMLRAVAFYEDPFGERTEYTAAAVLINQPTRGNINVEVVGDGEPVAGAILTVITSGLTDANVVATITYQWFDGDGGVATGQTISAPYVITSMDVSLAADNKPLEVRVILTDGLGFITTLSASFEPIAIEQEQLEEISGVLDVGAISEAVNVIGKHLSQVSGGAIGGGGDIGDEPQTYLEVNGVALESAQDISHAFSRRTSDSLQSDEAFRLDEFKVAYSGTDDSGASWSSWAQGGWSKLSGAPVVNDEVLKYDGNSFGVFVGADREFGESVRAGVAVGINKTEIDVDLNADGELDDKVTRKLNSILPYLEWRGAGSRGNLLFLGGYGVGELETELPNCSGNVDVEWLMASLQGKYSVPLTIGWDIVLNGGANISNSSSEKGTCGSSRELPGSESSTGEGSLGLDTVWTSRLANGGTIRPYVSFGARMAYGDLESKAAYDLGGGINVVFPAGLSFGIDGKRQINNTEHNRDSINGVLAFDYGAYKSSLTTTYNIADNKEGLVHRWEFNRISEWGVNTINSGIYVQRNAIDSNATSSAGLHVKMEWK